MNSLQRFVEAQQRVYDVALAEIESGRKETHWMWFIFPQIAGLGSSTTAKVYAISDLDEAKDFLSHPILGPRLVGISQALLLLGGNDANEIFGSPDHIKLRSSMTLFASVPNADPVFHDVLQKYFDGKPDIATLAKL